MPFILLLLPPLLGFVSLFGFNKRAERVAGYGGIICTVVGLAFSVYLTQNFLNSSQFIDFQWVTFGEKSITLSFLLDNVGLAMLLLVHLIALLVQMYSLSYMHEEVKWRYFAFLQLFVFAMLGIILAGNLIVMYIFWELVGLCSYLLIGYWYEKPRAVWAAKKAFLLNRVGDIGFLAGILLIVAFIPDLLDFTVTSPLHPLSTVRGGIDPSSLLTPDFSLLTIIGLLLFCGTIGKSAQLPLSAWLPDAMEGPTPVSALIHAATMVAAGVFLLARIHYMLTPIALLVIAIVGTITMLWAAYRALFQTEIKKLLAYSTISQLGLMVMAMGIEAREASLFHLFTHAFFKAGLFLCAGVILHNLNLTPFPSPSERCGVKRGGEVQRNVLFWTYTICAAALVGLPFTSGFLSKDLILVSAFEWASARGGIYYSIPITALISAGLTAAYMMRQWRMVFNLSPAPSPIWRGVSQSDGVRFEGKGERIHIAEKIPLMVLAGLSVFFWFSFNPFHATDSWLLQLIGYKSSDIAHQSIDFHTIVPILAIVVAGIGLVGGYWSTLPDNQFLKLLQLSYIAMHTLLSDWGKGIKRHWFEILRQHEATEEQGLFLIKPMQKIAQFLYAIDLKLIDWIVNAFGYATVIIAHLVGRFDKMVVDGGVNGLAWVAGFLGNRARRVQNGKIQSYFMALIVGILILIYIVL